MKIRRIVVAAAVLVFASAAIGDHAPEWLLSQSNPETTLAGVRVGESTVRELIQRYGEPCFERRIPDYPETEYVWDLPRSKIAATTMHPEGMVSGDQVVYSLEVRQKLGQRSTVQTGAGVSMGATLDAVVAAYGSRYITAWRKLSEESATITFIFEKNETELAFGFSDDGYVIAISLTESQE